MKRQFPRELLWTDIKTVDEFLTMPAARPLLDIYNDMHIFRRFPTGEGNAMKVLNEIYFQANRVMFEQAPEPQLKRYITDIKANLGERRLAEHVLWLTLCLLGAAGDDSAAVRTFIQQGDSRYRTPMFDWLGFTIEDIARKAGNVKGQLKPRPCKPQELDALVLDWYSLTRGFSYEGLDMVLALWDSDSDRLQVLDRIEDAYNHDDMASMGCVPIRWDYFDIVREQLGGVSMHYMAAEPFYTADDLKQKNMLLERRVNELESENAMLRSQLNNAKPKNKQERAFALKLIVDYCKKKSSWADVKDIVAMLYKFIRGGTAEEEALVDSIEDELNARMGTGMRVQSADIHVLSPGNIIAKDIRYGTE